MWETAHVQIHLHPEKAELQVGRIFSYGAIDVGQGASVAFEHEQDPGPLRIGDCRGGSEDRRREIPQRLAVALCRHVHAGAGRVVRRLPFALDGARYVAHRFAVAPCAMIERRPRGQGLVHVGVERERLFEAGERLRAFLAHHMDMRFHKPRRRLARIQRD